MNEEQMITFWGYEQEGSQEAAALRIAAQEEV